VVREEGEISESVEMYLITISMLQEQERPVPLSLLAEKLSHSPVSVNEMCRKLTEWEWADYQPYKGVILTPEGEVLANHVLFRRRLWEVFLVEKLGFGPSEAEDMACNLEHATSNDLAERLADFLDNPGFSPQNQPIPYCNHLISTRPVRALADLSAGHQGQVISVSTEEAVKQFLRVHGIVPGVSLEVIAAAQDGPMLLTVSSHHVTLSRELAAQINVSTTPFTEAAGEQVDVDNEEKPIRVSEVT
jgi:DtxR family Mn-dependent transcriptional regulator